MVLGQVVGVEAGGLGRLQELQPLLVELLERCRAPIDPVEQPEGHLCHRRPPTTAGLPSEPGREDTDRCSPGTPTEGPGPAFAGAYASAEDTGAWL